MKYYIYAIHPGNVNECLKQGLIAVKDRGKEVLKKVQPGEKFIFYAGRPELKFFGYGVIRGKYKFDNKKIIWPDEKKKGKVIYPHRVKVRFIKSNAEIEIKDVLEKLSFIKNKKKYGLYFLNTFFKIPERDYLLLKRGLEQSKKTYRFREEITRKEFGNKFHDRIKKLFLETGFDIVKSDYYAPGPDIIAKFENNKIIIQCKKRERKDKDQTYTSLQRLIDEYSRKVQKEHAKAAILAISGFKISKDIDTDLAIKEDKVAVWDDQLIGYYEDLSKKIPSTAKYQILSDLGVHSRFGKDIKVNAMKINQKNYSFYVFKAKPDFLLKSCRVLRHFKPEDSKGYQRMLNEKRIKREIPDFLKKETALLPNTIICVSDKSLKLDKGKLIIPSYYGSLWIMDGQHRLYAFANIDDTELLNNYDLLCVVFDGEKVKEYIQGEIFVDINQTAKKVPIALLLEIGYSLGWRIVAVEVVKKLRNLDLFKERIKMYTENKRGLKQISFATFCTNQATKILLDVNRGLLFKKVSSGEEDRKVKIGYDVFREYFKIISKHFKEEWNNPKEFILATDRGIMALLHLLKLILEKINYVFDEKYVIRIMKMLKSSYLESKTKLRNEEFKGFAGETGAREIMATWASAINEFIPDFYLKPAGIEELITPIYIKRGDRKKAEKCLKEWFSRFEGEIYVCLNFIDISTINYLQEMLPRTVKNVRIIVDLVKDRPKFKEKIEEMIEAGYNISIFEFFRTIREGNLKKEVAIAHGRWIGDKNFYVNLETDLKKDAIANKNHYKKLYRWKDSVLLKKFNTDWEKYSDLIGKNVNFYGKQN